MIENLWYGTGLLFGRRICKPTWTIVKIHDTERKQETATGQRQCQSDGGILGIINSARDRTEVIGGRVKITSGIGIDSGVSMPIIKSL